MNSFDSIVESDQRLSTGSISTNLLLTSSLRSSHSFRIRDSTLLALALTSKAVCKLFQPLLLQSITIFPAEVPYLCRSVLFYGSEESQRIGGIVKSLTIKAPTRREDQDMGWKDYEADYMIRKVTSGRYQSVSEVPVEQLDVLLSKGMDLFFGSLYFQLRRLQTLVVLFPDALLFPLKFQGVICPFLTHSLKRLHVGKDIRQNTSLLTFNGSNALWILCFCPLLQEAILRFQISLKDSKLLSENAEAFKGVSNVKRLCIDTFFGYVPAREETCWGQKTGIGKKFRLGSRKTDAIFSLLRVTKNLESCEIDLDYALAKRHDTTDVSSIAVTGLIESSESLKHLRVFGLSRNEHGQPAADYRLFKSLKILTVDCTTVAISTFAIKNCLPISLEILGFDHYSSFETQNHPDYEKEDYMLARLITKENVPNLKMLAVPEFPVNRYYHRNVHASYNSAWEKGRAALKSIQSIKSGKIGLRLLQPREIRELLRL